MRTYEERAQYILKQRDERLAKRRRIRSAVTLSAVSVCSLALIAGAGIAVNRFADKDGAVWISPNNSVSPSEISGTADSRVTDLPAELIENPRDLHSVYKFSMPEFPDVDFSIDNGNIVADGKKLFGGKMPASLYLADLNGDGYRELCTDWGVFAPPTPLDMGICALDFVSGEYYVLSDPTGDNEYHLTLEDGKLEYLYCITLKDQVIEKQSKFTLSDMMCVSDGYFVKPGEALPAEWVYNRNDHMNSSTPFEFTTPEFPGVNFKVDDEAVSANGKKLYDGMPIFSVYLADLNGDGYRELCSDIAYGSGIVDTRIRVYDYANKVFCNLYELSDRGRYDYVLALEDGVLKYKKNIWYYLNSNPGQENTIETDVLTLSIMKWVENNGSEAEKLYPRDNSDIENILEINDNFEFTIPELPDSSFKLVKGVLSCDGEFLIQGYPIHSIYLADLDGDGVREVVAEYSVGEGIVNMNIFAYDPAAKELYTLSDTDNKEYVLTYEYGVLGYKHCIYGESGITTDEEGELTLSRMEKFSSLCGLPKADSQPSSPYLSFRF